MSAKPRQINIRIVPRPAFEPYLLRKQRFSCIVAHRRAGKTYSCIQDLLARALTHNRPGPPLRYGYIAPTRDQAKDITWNYLTSFCEQIPKVQFNRADLSLTLPNLASIRLYSGDSYDRMRGLYFDGVVIDEPADIDPRAWPFVVRPCLTDYAGWATFIGTPKGQNAFYRIWRESADNPNWFSFVLRASKSGIIPPTELESLKAGMPMHAYQQEYECDFTAPIPGAIYADALNRLRESGGMTTDVLWERGALVWTAWDLGAPENTAIWYFQEVAGEIRLIDYDTGLNLGPAERVAHMLRKGYSYGGHLMPHDAEATQKNSLTFRQEMESAGLSGIRVVPRTINIWLGISRMREIMPRCRFKLPECEAGLAALEWYHRRENKATGQITDDPEHDWASHGSDSFRYIGEGLMHTLAGKASLVSPNFERPAVKLAGHWS